MKEHGKVSQKKENGVPIGASGASDTTIGIYSRTLRVVFNDAIEAKIIERDSYPFGNKGFSPPVGRVILRKHFLPVKLMQSKRMSQHQILWNNVRMIYGFFHTSAMA
jgi:hypothetical protein